MKIKIKKLDPQFADVPLPKYSTSGSAGMDVCAAIDKDLTLEAGKILLVPTNLSIELPSGYECQVRSRSGLAAKNGVFCLNSPGTIDSDYRGEIKVILANFSANDFIVSRGMRIAQLVIAQYEFIDWEESENLSFSARADGGFGSTGV